MKIGRFIKDWHAYNEGETAGFSDQFADDLVEAKVFVLLTEEELERLREEKAARRNPRAAKAATAKGRRGK